MNTISGLADFTNKVASETNMIGLNASIQSAHAGEYGKGFLLLQKKYEEWLIVQVSLRKR